MQQFFYITQVRFYLICKSFACIFEILQDANSNARLVNILGKTSGIQLDSQIKNFYNLKPFGS